MVRPTASKQGSVFLGGFGRSADAPARAGVADQTGPGKLMERVAQVKKRPADAGTPPPRSLQASCPLILSPDVQPNRRLRRTCRTSEGSIQRSTRCIFKSYSA